MTQATKIVATLGPASSTPEVVSSMIVAGIMALLMRVVLVKSAAEFSGAMSTPSGPAKPGISLSKRRIARFIPRTTAAGSTSARSHGTPPNG